MPINSMLVLPKTKNSEEFENMVCEYAQKNGIRYFISMDAKDRSRME